MDETILMLVMVADKMADNLKNVKIPILDWDYSQAQEAMGKDSNVVKKVLYYLERLLEIEPLYRQLEVINQVNQKPAKTMTGAPIRVGQGHNMTYAHARWDLSNPEIFKPHRKKILVNWDAHRDTGDPFFGYIESPVALEKLQKVAE